MFREAGAWVHDSDLAVHRLYEVGGAAVPAILELASAAVEQGAVDRSRLGALVQADPGLLRRIEDVVHPLVAEDRSQFVIEAENAKVEVVVFDIPLLFETGSERLVDAVVVVTASQTTQRRRALERPGMTVERFESILRQQLPDAEKRRRADFLIDTDQGLEVARTKVGEIMRQLKSSPQDTV